MHTHQHAHASEGAPWRSVASESRVVDDKRSQRQAQVLGLRPEGVWEGVWGQRRGWDLKRCWAAGDG